LLRRCVVTRRYGAWFYAGELCLCSKEMKVVHALQCSLT